MSGSKTRKIAGYAGLLGVVMVVVMLVAFNQFRASDSFQTAERFVLANGHVERLVGPDVTVGRLSQASVNRNADGTGTATYTFRVSGDGGRVDAAVELLDQGMGWQVVGAYYRDQTKLWRGLEPNPKPGDAGP